MAVQRKDPYVCPTWVTKLMAGEQSCGWAAWFRAHYSDFVKRERSGDLIGWTARHNELCKKRADELRSQGYTVYVEDQNKFNLKGSSGTVGGKPDIVAVLENKDAPGPGPHPPYDVVVVECKGGKKRDSDHFQLQMYMLVLPMTHEACKGQVVRGELEYADGPVLIDTVPKRIADVIYSTIREVCGPTPLPKAPSFRECQFCDLTKVDCKERVETKERTVKSDAF